MMFIISSASVNNSTWKYILLFPLRTCVLLLISHPAFTDIRSVFKAALRNTVPRQRDMLIASGNL